ncbi:MAG TPA: hypothetical protein VGZ22_09560 [Isosphaeraceae bacterium]|jgi:hypothetical protein|nr:hypothetical protein [Isosphaeraceae bacterium]
MDQLKEFLRLAIKYRFWIAVGLAALLPMIGYFVGASSISAEANAKAQKIVSSDKAVKEYISGTKPNAQYKGVVQTKTDELTTDVNGAWRKLYARQAPLLTWPSGVDQFTQWTRKYPEGVDPASVQDAVNKYINAYNEYVDSVYKKFRPWDPQTGTGVVLALPKEALLQPFPFDETEPPSDLSKIWSAQEKLWVQAALLEVIDKVNKNAKDWDSAIIKQIIDLQVANPLALDQVAVADGVTLQPSEKLTKGGVSDTPAPAAGGGGGGAPGSGSSYSQGSTTPSATYGGTMGGSGGMAGSAAATEVSYLSSSNKQFQVVPVSLAVYIDQNSINNLLVELANSPMSIQVIDYSQQRPGARLKKPEKGESLPGGGMGGYGMAGGYGEAMFNAQGAYPGGGGGGYASGGGYPSGANAMYSQGGMGGMGGSGAATAKAHGKDVSDRDFQKEREERKKKRSTKGVQIQDPYYNIVEVRIFGQARFYSVPPAEQPAESTSPGDVRTTEPAKDENAPADATKTAPEARGDETKDAKPDETKTDADKEKADAPKTDEAKDKKTDEVKDNTKETKPSPEASKTKDEPAKDEPAKSEPPKAEAPKAEAPKADAKK